ncbi:MAG: HDOD domain-containing protein [Mariprofundaceae bacterium]|nr:HDOD domain-containing protein [Mariprofundaceae bacterium]
MGWLKNIFTAWFGQGLKQPTKHEKHSKSTRPPSKTSDPVAISDEYPAQTLGFLLKHCPQVRADAQRYDLQNPPALGAKICSHLNGCIHDIPPMPEIWHEVQNILQRDDASIRDLGQCVAQDPILTAKILKVCNSSAYMAAGGVEVNNIPLAIARLGLNEASSIIFQTLAPDLGGDAQRKQEIRHVWFHSQAIAMLSRILAEPTTLTTRSAATLHGMLHDIGKLVILHIATDTQLHDLKDSIAQGESSLVAEYHILGYSHIDAGMMLALHWNLPKHIKDMIASHHHPAVVQSHLLAPQTQHAMMILHAAHLILQSELYQPEQSSGSSSLPLGIWQSHQRTCLTDTLYFVQNNLLIPLDSASLYEHIRAEVARLKLSFADLF